jgi:nucleoside 2-deoxyribosyltransferase
MQCYLTGFETQTILHTNPYSIYSINLWGKDYTFPVAHETLKDFNYKDFQHIFRGLIYNNKWSIPQGEIITADVLKKLLASSNYPKTLKDKKDNLFLYLLSAPKYDGEKVLLPLNLEIQFKLYFRDYQEVIFYIKALNKDGLIDLAQITQVNMQYQITFAGLEYAIGLQEEGINSNKCFVAMSFTKNAEIKKIREAIRSACNQTGFEAIYIDKVHPEDGQTINDSIIAHLKMSRFCIADFTEQKDGVYFESGYALGRGLKVIYACREDWFKESHFDTNHFPHIIYKDEDELKRELVDRIIVRIKD